MRRRTAFTALVCSTCFALPGCAWVGGVLDEVTGLPVFHVFSDIKDTAEEIGEEEQAERVEELSAEYEEFVRARDAQEAEQDTSDRSVMFRQDDEK